MSLLFLKKLKAWHLAGLFLFIAIFSISIYVFLKPRPEETTSHANTVAQSTEAKAKVEVVEVRTHAFPILSEATGHLAAWRQTAVSSETFGRVATRHVELGAWVEAGSPLFSLDATEARLAVAEAEAEVLRAKADYAIKSLQDEQVSPDTSQLYTARQQFKQAQTAFKGKQISQQTFQTIQRRFESARLLSGQNRSNVQAVLTGLTQAEQKLERARLQLARTHITAPISGRVTALQAEQGQQVQTGQILMTLLEDNRMKVTVSVTESDLAQLKQGAFAQIRIPALNNALYRGEIFAIDPLVNTQKGMGSVTVAVRNADFTMITGTFAYVSLETKRLQGALVVPSDAILVRQGRDLVFVIKDGRAAWVYVKLGERSGPLVSIIEGLKVGDLVAVKGHFALAHDAPVEIIKTQPLNPLLY